MWCRQCVYDGSSEILENRDGYLYIWVGDGCE